MALLVEAQTFWRELMQMACRHEWDGYWSDAKNAASSTERTLLTRIGATTQRSC